MTEHPSDDSDAGVLSGGRWYESDALARELSQLTEAERALYADSDQLSVRPVALPRTESVVTGNDYYDWPIACRTDDAIVVLFDRRRYHWGGDEDRTDEHSGIRMITRSTDGGQTWTEPLDIWTQAGRWSETLFDGWGGGLGVHDGTVYLALNEGLYRSTDDGATWALTTESPTFSTIPFDPVPTDPHDESSTAGTAVATAPFWSPATRLTFDDEHGLTIWTTRGFKPTGRDGETNSHYGNYLCALWSPDFGRSWNYHEQELPDGLFLNEITPLQFHDGKLAFFLRNGIRGSRFGQAYASDGWFPFEFAISNVGPVDIMDTPELSYNPQNGRLEAVAPFRHFDRPIELHLYSMDPATLATGNNDWRFEGVLLRYRDEWGSSDGFNPVGGIVDGEAGVHQFYVWGGEPTTKAGIFQYSRSLDTPRLRDYLRLARE